MQLKINVNLNKKDATTSTIIQWADIQFLENLFHTPMVWKKMR